MSWENKRPQHTCTLTNAKKVTASVFCRINEEAKAYIHILSIRLIFMGCGDKLTFGWQYNAIVIVDTRQENIEDELNCSWSACHLDISIVCVCFCAVSPPKNIVARTISRYCVTNCDINNGGTVDGWIEISKFHRKICSSPKNYSFRMEIVEYFFSYLVLLKVIVFFQFLICKCLFCFYW